jgi:menaquinone-specific isochorismate synthase
VAGAAVRVATACLELPGASPLEFLRGAPGARGFWARGERWIAHTGTLAVVAADPGPDRFRQVRDAAAGVVGEPGPTWPADADPRLAGSLRFYGGFSFQDEPGSSHLWLGFPIALFHLPAVELEGDAEGVRLRVRSIWSAGEDEDALRQRLETRASELAERMSRSRLEALSAPSLSLDPVTTSADLPVIESDRSVWEASVERVLQAIVDGRVVKVVLARTLDVRPCIEIDPIAVLGHLWKANRGTHVFFFEPSPGRAVLGAAPETIATLRRGMFRATAVAGSIRPGTSEEEQAVLADSLLLSGKDRAEHRIAVEDMLERLGRVAEGVRAEPEPHVLTLPAIQHLESEIRARVHGGMTVLEVLAALHPTPAVCGFPRDQAQKLLAQEEGFERGWYAGPVGWFDLEGDGVFAPALRSAVLSEGSWRLFAGAGIVAGSCPDAEWTETAIKLETVLRALGAASPR